VRVENSSKKDWIGDFNEGIRYVEKNYVAVFNFCLY
jgi:hypothetical protein